MLLEKLKEYGEERIPSTPSNYVETPVRYLIELGEDGTLLSPTPTVLGDTKIEKRGKPMLVPYLKRAGTRALPTLLADRSDYTFGIALENATQKQTEERYSAYLNLLQLCWKETQEPAVGAVLTFLRNDPAGKLELPDEYECSALVTFRVGSTIVVDLPAVRTFWGRLNDPDASSEKPAARMQCLICGKQKPVLSRLQGVLKNIPGGNPTGTSIISANSAAFESYGLEASLIAPTCAECGELFTKGANALLADRKQRVSLGGVVYIFWTQDKDSDFSFGEMFNEPDAASVHKLLTSLSTGKRTGLVDESAFYAASFSGNNARAVVRDWLDTTVGKAKASIGRWFNLQRIVGQYGEAPFSTERNPPLNLFRLATATVRDAKDIQRETTTALVRAALLGAPIPLYILQAVINRCRAERNVNLQQATLIKMVLMSHDEKFRTPDFNEEDDLMVTLNPEAATAFQCGRLLSVLENAQSAAIPGIKASLVDRFYGAASSTPATAFPPLLRTLQNHLGKLERDKRGAYVRLQAELEEIMGHIGSQFPRTLTLQQQGEFALGYYHQRARERARIGEAAERKKSSNMNVEPDED